MAITENLIIIVDNSEFNIKTDLGLTLRWAQQNAVTAICGIVLELNPSSKVGVVTLSRSTTLVKLETISINHLNTINERLHNLHDDDIKKKGSLTKALGLARSEFESHLNVEHKNYIIIFIGKTVALQKDSVDMCAHLIKTEKIRVSAITFGVNCITTNGMPNFIQKTQMPDDYGNRCMVVCILTCPENFNHDIPDRNSTDKYELKDNFVIVEIVYDTNRPGENELGLKQDIYFPIIYHNTMYYSAMEDLKYYISFGKFIESDNQYVRFGRSELDSINKEKNAGDKVVFKRTNLSDYQI